ncbi:MAG: hypothetical protein RL722_2379 [Pseudomonadota bacterium]|jgi:ABC-type multidrug transport system ATPase subunit
MTEPGLPTASADPAGHAISAVSGLQVHVHVQDLTLAWPGQPALFRHWHFELAPGLHHLQGERGKTSLIQLLAGEAQALAACSAGRFHLNGEAWQPAAGVPRVFHLDPRSPAWNGHTPEAIQAEVARRQGARFDLDGWQHYLEGLALQPHLGKRMDMLSTGSRRKVMLAATLASGADLLLLDDATAGLDQPSLAWLGAALAELAQSAELAVGSSTSAVPAPVCLIAAPWGLQDELPWASTLDLPEG